VARDGRDPIGGPELPLVQGNFFCRPGLSQPDLRGRTDPGGLRRAPYLLGERTPHLDPEVRVAFAGVSTVHSAVHFVRCVLEDAAYSLEDTFMLFAELSIPVSTIRLGGGGARGPLWRGIQASVYGQAVEVLAAKEGGAFASALLAGVGAGRWANLDEACAQAIQVAQRIEPTPADVATYKRG